MKYNSIGYVLSALADDDLERIFDYTEEQFGFNQAVSYLTNLDLMFTNLIKHPEIGRIRDEIKPGLLSIVIKEHIIFYKITTQHIKIIRVLHGSVDLPTFFRK